MKKITWVSSAYNKTSCSDKKKPFNKNRSVKKIIDMAIINSLKK